MEAKEYVIQIQDSYLAELIFHWIQYDKPCKLLFQKPKSDNLTAIRLMIDGNETASFVLQLRKATNCRVYEKTPQGMIPLDL
jgi:hypothetical protein